MPDSREVVEFSVRNRVLAVIDLSISSAEYGAFAPKNRIDDAVGRRMTEVREDEVDNVLR